MDDGEDYRSKYLYALAEVENTRKRWERRADETASDVKRRLLREFLPILDSLEQALRYDDAERVRTGIEATVRAFESLLANEGVTPIVTTGLRFDPRLAQAVEARPVEGVEDEIVVGEERRGYLADDAVLRPAHVIVAKQA